MRCLEAPVSLKVVKQAREANRSYIEKRKRSAEQRSDDSSSGKRWKS